jgi:hypothetical protein
MGNTAIEGCITALRRCEAVLDALEPGHYSMAPEGHGSVGAQVRHCIDHFSCFLHGVDSGVVDYDARERDVNLETDKALARSAITSIMESVIAMSATPLDTAITVKLIAAADGPPISAASTLERELVFLSSHTIHHVAIMCLVAERVGARVSPEVGLAFSTEAYRAANTHQS